MAGLIAKLAICGVSRHPAYSNVRSGLIASVNGPLGGSALHVMLFLKNPIRVLFIFNGLRSRHCPRALLG